MSGSTLNPVAEQVPALETVKALAPHLKQGQRLLDVGCGKGHLSALLAERGFKVTALDKREEAVARARANGVPALHADFLEFEDEPFDALIFSRVLHHVAALEACLVRAKQLLKPGGLVFVEDFAYERMDAASAAWFYGLEDVLLTTRQLSRPLTGGEGETGLERWQDHNRRHGIQSGAAMLEALSGPFGRVAQSAPPYLYRYVAARLNSGGEAAKSVLTWERSLIESAAVRALGLRWLGRRR